MAATMPYFGRNRCIVLVLLFGWLFISCDAQQKLTNIDYLGLGYDVIFGNPHSDLADPGFRSAVFLLDYTDQSVSSDGKWLVPDNVQALQTSGCGYETNTLQIHGTSSYANSLAIEASIEGPAGVWLSSFSASADYKQVRQGTKLFHRSYISSVAQCLVYHAAIKRLSNGRLTDDFTRAVKSLPTTLDRAQYLRFISVFGTHYASSLSMGSKAVIRSEFQETAWTTMESNGFNFKAGAQASFLGFTGGLKFATDYQKELAHDFDSNRTSMVAAYMGCRPSSDGKWETWMDSTQISPYPIAYTVRPLIELLTTQYFPNTSSDVLYMKRAILNATYAEYCRGSPGCGPPDMDRIPVRLDRPDSAIIRTQRTSCRAGMSLLSCGLGNLSIPTTSESNRTAVPIEEDSCECFANYGAVCQPWCTNVVLQGFEIKSSGFTKGDFAVNCSKGKRVLGCAIDARAGTAAEWWKSFYPRDDGTQCSCHADYGAYCIATCANASNIQNYEIRSQYGVNNVTVSCSPGNYVLGCGVEPYYSRYYDEPFRTCSVSSINTCTCYDRYGVTCYAVCGQFA